eukprot:761188-Hanusia_phi.AAC.2
MASPRTNSRVQHRLLKLIDPDPSSSSSSSQAEAWSSCWRLPAACCSSLGPLQRAPTRQDELASARLRECLASMAQEGKNKEQGTG